ncbi:transposase domain-containing protein [Streptomyces asiaticus]|uniref:transposase domain-containing protein n=1 Tax=Streptomyces asiaticus TaxID=114695 RepID=UPI00374DC605
MSELSGLGLLTWVYPPGLVDRVVGACGCGCAEQRRRLLPARLVVYSGLGLALFSPAPYLEVMRHPVEGLRCQGLLGGWHVPAKSSLFRARQRLGCEPLRVLFATTAKPTAAEATPGAGARSRRCGWLLDLPEDSAANHNRSVHWYPTGLASCLRSTAFSCRSTSNPASLAVCRRSNTAGTESSFRVT